MQELAWAHQRDKICTDPSWGRPTCPTLHAGAMCANGQSKRRRNRIIPAGFLVVFPRSLARLPGGVPRGFSSLASRAPASVTIEPKKTASD
jgi:hypothetical protein